MKIVLINTRYFPEAEAGPAFSVQVLAETLVSGGHSVEVVCLGKHLQHPCEHHEGVVIHRLSPGTDEPHVGEQVFQILDRLGPDVVHTHWLTGFPLAHLGSIVKSAGVRLVHTLHEHRFLCSRGTMYRDGQGPCKALCADCGDMRAASSEFARHVNGVIGVSRFTLDLHLRAGLFPAAHSTAVIATGFRGPDHPLPSPEGTGKPLKLGYLGRFSPSKGLFWLLRQLGDSDLGKEVIVKIAGRHSEDLPEQVAASLPSRKIDWLGFVQPRDLMEQIDWLIVPSLCYDALPRVVFEAFGFGVPVLGSAVGGIPEMIEHGHNGRLFSPYKPNDLFNEIQWLVSHSDEWPAYREAAWASRTAYFPEVVAEEHLAVYTGEG